MALILSAQFGLNDLARSSVRQVFHHHIVRQPPTRNTLGKMGQHGFAGNRLSRVQDEQQQRAFLPASVRHADHCRFPDAGVANGGILQVDGGDPLALGLNDSLRTIGDLDEAVGVDPVTCRRP